MNEFNQNIGSQPPYPNPQIFGEGTDWQDVIFRDAPIQNYNLNINGGSETMTYNISGDVFLQDVVEPIEFLAHRSEQRLHLDDEEHDQDRGDDQQG